MIGHFQGELVVEAALGNAADQRHLTAFENGQGIVTGAGALALVAFAGRLAQARADAATEPLARLVAMDVLMNFVQIHDNDTPRSRSTSDCVRSCCNASMAALARLCGLLEP